MIWPKDRKSAEAVGGEWHIKDKTKEYWGNTKEFVGKAGSYITGSGGKDAEPTPTPTPTTGV